MSSTLWRNNMNGRYQEYQGGWLTFKITEGHYLNHMCFERGRIIPRRLRTVYPVMARFLLTWHRWSTTFKHTHKYCSGLQVFFWYPSNAVLFNSFNEFCGCIFPIIYISSTSWYITNAYRLVLGNKKCYLAKWSIFFKGKKWPCQYWLLLFYCLESDVICRRPTHALLCFCAYMIFFLFTLWLRWTQCVLRELQVKLNLFTETACCGWSDGLRTR